MSSKAKTLQNVESCTVCTIHIQVKSSKMLENSGSIYFMLINVLTFKYMHDLIQYIMHSHNYKKGYIERRLHASHYNLHVSNTKNYAINMYSGGQVNLKSSGVTVLSVTGKCNSLLLIRYPYLIAKAPFTVINYRYFNLIKVITIYNKK
jgi:hypothetical protein